jgi:signal transduction histidine kinase
MPAKLRDFFGRLTLSQRFMWASMVILVGGTIGLGEWVGKQIELGVIHRTAATTALFVDSFIAPSLQEMAYEDELSQVHIATLNRLLQETQMGQQIVAFKVWDVSGRVLYSTETSTIGQVYPIEEGLSLALQGQVVTQISDLQKAENLLERVKESRLLETYSPVRLGGTNQVIAVAEFYQKVDGLHQEISAAQQRSWLVVGLAMLVMYALLAGFVRRASETIERQQLALSRQVDQLTELLGQNEVLRERIRKAAAGFTALNERFLRRFSAELHDGPLQDLGLAMLRLGHVETYFAKPRKTKSNEHAVEDDLGIIHSSLLRAIEEIRSLSAGLGAPQLNELTLSETVSRAVNAHEQRSHTKVALHLSCVPDKVSLPVKITIYRFVQESLQNAYRHARGLGQQVLVSGMNGQVRIEVSDRGPGFSMEKSFWWDKHLGLVGMRERVESLGGTFLLESEPGQGTKVIANLFLQGVEENEEDQKN